MKLQLLPKDKKGFIENWGLFILFFAIGFIMMLVVLKVWSKMDYQISWLTKLAILTIVPAAASAWMTAKYQNG